MREEISYDLKAQPVNADIQAVVDQPDPSMLWVFNRWQQTRFWSQALDNRTSQEFNAFKQQTDYA